MSPWVVGIIAAIWLVLNFIYIRLGTIIRILDELTIMEEEDTDE